MDAATREAGFAEFVAAAYPGLVRTAFVLVGDRGAAEDLVQSALVQVYGRWDGIAPGAALAYTRVVMVRLGGRWGRRRWRGELPTADLPETPADAGGPDVDGRLDALAALRRLPWGQRAALTLRFLEDLSEAQTAAALGCSIGTVKSRVSRGLATLREQGALLEQGAGDDRAAPPRADRAGSAPSVRRRSGHRGLLEVVDV